MKSIYPLALAFGLTAGGAALASDDCRSPMADWQSREAATAHVSQLGIAPERLRVDDGCYEVRGRDADGHRVELKLEPATLGLVKLEVRFGPGDKPARYLPGAKAPQGAQSSGSGSASKPPRATGH